MESFGKLLNQCKKRKMRAQMAFYELFCQDVYNSCYRILLDKMLAEEVMQDTFLKVLNRLDDFTGNEASMHAYLCRIAVNKSIDLQRQKKIDFLSFEDLANELPNETVLSEQNEEDVERIKGIINTLPQGYRLVLTLHILEEMSYEDIAEQLHVSVSTVRSQYIRARDKVKILLKGN